MAEDYGIAVGSNLNTDSLLSMKMTSADSSLKLYKWVNAQFTTNGSGVGSVTISHDLGYVPIVQVWGKHDAQYSFLSSTTYSNVFSLIDSANSYRPYSYGIEFFAESDKITIRTITPGLGPTVLPSTTYYFRVLIWVDLSQSFTGHSNIALTGDYGFKVSNKDKNVLTDEEYNMTYSSKYKAIQYYQNHILHQALTLPEMWASKVDTFEEEAVFVDFNHNLGYPPFFLAYVDFGDGFLFEIPYSEAYSSAGHTQGFMELSAWSDINRVRILFKRSSTWVNGDFGKAFAATTVQVYLLMTTENLAGAESP